MVWNLTLKLAQVFIKNYFFSIFTFLPVFCFWRDFCNHFISSSDQSWRTFPLQLAQSDDWGKVHRKLQTWVWAKISSVFFVLGKLSTFAIAMVIGSTVAPKDITVTSWPVVPKYLYYFLVQQQAFEKSGKPRDPTRRRKNIDRSFQNIDLFFWTDHKLVQNVRLSLCWKKL